MGLHVLPDDRRDLFGAFLMREMAEPVQRLEPPVTDRRRRLARIRNGIARSASPCTSSTGVFNRARSRRNPTRSQAAIMPIAPAHCADVPSNAA